MDLDTTAQGQQITFVWSVKTLADALWGVEYLREGAQVYVTRGRGSKTNAGAHEEEEEDQEGIELQERARLMEHDVEGAAAHTAHDDDDEAEGERLGIPAHITINRSRPNFAHIVHEIFTATPPPGEVAVLVCGPSGIGAALRREVGVWVGRGKEVWWHGEEFGW